MSLLSPLTYTYKTNHYSFACGCVADRKHTQFKSLLFISFVSACRICVICVIRKTLLVGQFSNVTGQKLISWTNQSVVVIESILLRAGELTDLFTYHEVVTNNSVEMKEVHKKGAGDGTASYSNKKTNGDCHSESTASIFTNHCIAFTIFSCFLA